MDLDEARTFLADHHQAVMATYRSDGSAQLSPVTVGVDGDGLATVSTRETAVKTRNLQRDPRTSLCVMSEQFFGPWIRIDGRARIVALPEAMDGLVDYYRRISGEHPDWDDYRQAMVDQRRVLVRVVIEVAGPDVSG